MYKNILLSEAEMRKLDDDQDWYKPGDVVYVEGYTPETEIDNAPFQLSVNGEVHDNWIYWADMPKWLKRKLS